MFNVLFAVVSYLFVIASILALPLILFLCIFCFGKKRLAQILAGLLLSAELICGAILYVRPLFYCPKEYVMYIDEEKKNSLKAGNLPARRGFWSANIPSFVVFNQVTYAAENTIHVRAWYFPFGSCETGVNSDGLYPVN